MNYSQLSTLTWEVGAEYFRKRNFLNLLIAWIVLLICISALSFPLIMDSTGESNGILQKIVILAAVVSLVAWIAIGVNKKFSYKNYNYQIEPDQFIVIDGIRTDVYRWEDLLYFTREPIGMGGYKLPIAKSLAYNLKTYNFIIFPKGNKREFVVFTKNQKESDLVGEMLGRYLGRK